MTESDQPRFLDVPTLLEQSQPRAMAARIWQVMGVFFLIAIISALISSHSGEAATVMNVVSGLVMMVLIAAMGLISWNTIRQARAEQGQLEAIEELVRLRRWMEAGMVLEQMLSRPTRTPQARIQALIFLTGVLGRYNRFDDAIHVQDYLLENAPLDGGTAHGLKLARAMAMLREDHLFDADRAIGALRQDVTRAGRAMNEANPDKEFDSPQSLSAGLALVEIYRDVKTGHPTEAIELFNSTQSALREQLGHRVADAHILIAKAYDLLGREAEAQDHYEKATFLATPAELHRRYPDATLLVQKYRPADAPKEAA